MSSYPSEEFVMQSEEELMEEQLAEFQLQEIFKKLQFCVGKRKQDHNFNTSFYMFDRFLKDLDFLLNESPTPTMREKVVKLREQVVHSYEVLWSEMASALAPSVKRMERVVVGSSSSLLGGEVCAICQEDFEVGDEVSVPSCSHKYHQKCIFRWLGSSNSCPVCRVALEPDEA